MGGIEIAAVSVVVAILGLAGTACWRFYTMIQTERSERTAQAGMAQAASQLVRQELSEHKLHVAETYVTKSGMAEQTQQIMKALESLGGRVDGIHARLDTWARHQ